jgi:hypothetical protein
VAGSCECGGEPSSGSGTMDLVSFLVYLSGLPSMRLVLLLHIYNSSISLVTFFCGISQLFIICVQSELQTVNRKRVWQTLKVHAQGVAPPML